MYGKKPIVSVTYDNERISLKKQLTLLKMVVTSLLCGPRADLWPFNGFLCKRFSLYIKVSLQCKRILGGRNLVRVRNIVVAAIFDFMTVEDWGE